MILSRPPHQPAKIAHRKLLTREEKNSPLSRFQVHRIKKFCLRKNRAFGAKKYHYFEIMLNGIMQKLA